MFYMALRRDGTLWSWGINTEGQLGNGTTDYHGSAADAVKVIDNVSDISAGLNHAMAVRKDGSLWGWGDNSDGVLGLGKRVKSQLTPVRIADKVGDFATDSGVSLWVTPVGELFFTGEIDYFKN